MADRQHILVAIDDFPMTQHLEDCLRESVRDRKAVTIHLFHALGPLPPQLLESRGAEDPADEEKVEAEQVQQQESWFLRARQEAEPLLQTATAARDNDCVTIVVGHKSQPWLREQFHAHTAVQLKSATPDVTVCVVNT